MCATWCVTCASVSLRCYCSSVAFREQCPSRAAVLSSVLSSVLSPHGFPLPSRDGRHMTGQPSCGVTSLPCGDPPPATPTTPPLIARGRQRTESADGSSSADEWWRFPFSCTPLEEYYSDMATSANERDVPFYEGPYHDDDDGDDDIDDIDDEFDIDDITTEGMRASAGALQIATKFEKKPISLTCNDRYSGRLAPVIVSSICHIFAFPSGSHL